MQKLDWALKLAVGMAAASLGSVGYMAAGEPMSPNTPRDSSNRTSALRVIDLRCEYRVNPLGIDSPAPRFSWIPLSKTRGESQSGYHILVSNSLETLNEDRGELWDSGLIHDRRPFGATYHGRSLHSGERAYWKVRAYDSRGRAGLWSRSASFEMGLLAKKDWRGKWLNDGRPTPALDADFYKPCPAPLFRKEFHAPTAVRRARLYIASLGYYEASLNGRRIGDHVLDPGWTNFGKRVGYATYDVTRQVRSGENCLGVTLGNGWYNPLPLKLFGTFNLREHCPVGRPRFIAQLNIEYVDGSTASVVSDKSWRLGEGAIQFDNIYLGEVVDARKAQPKWSLPGFAARDWREPGLATEPIGRLECPASPPIRITEKIPAVRVTEPKPGTFIYDFGKEFAGWASLRLQAKRGTKVVLRYGELLYKDGTLNPMTSVAGQIKGTYKNAQGFEESVGGPGAPPIAWQTDTYIAKGGGPETYTPKFTFHGFRYMEVTGLPSAPPLGGVIGLRLNADVASAGEFSCDNETFNRIQEMCRRTFLSNLFSVQSDCPHRERLGYGGDIVGTSEALATNFDMEGFYAKTVQDFADAARPDGMLTDTAPFIGIQYCGVGWAMAHPFVTDLLRRTYGDTRTTEMQYATAKRWIGLVDAKYPDGIVTDGLSDHEGLEANPPDAMVTPLYYQSVRLLESMARELGRRADETKFQRLAEKIRDAYQKRLIDASGKVGPGSQASQSFALYSGLAPETLRGKVVDYLLHKIRVDAKEHLSTGLMATKFMLEVLSREGYSEDAYKIVNQPDFPGWGWMLQNGATTLWEHWALDDNTYSHCHPMFGSVSEWFVRWLGGIQAAPGSVGFDRIEIRPQFVKGLHWAMAKQRGMYGEIVSRWERSSHAVELQLEIPVGTSAHVYLPGAGAVKESGQPISKSRSVRLVGEENGNRVYAVGSGRYSFRVGLSQ